MKKKIIQLKQIIGKGQKNLGLYIPIEEPYKSLVKTLPNVRWNAKEKCVCIPDTYRNRKQIFDLFKGVAWVDASSLFDKRQKQISRNEKETILNNVNQQASLSDLNRKNYQREVPSSYTQLLKRLNSDSSKLENSTVNVVQERLTVQIDEDFTTIIEHPNEAHRS